MKPQIFMASGRQYDIPTFDPVVANHFNNPASNTQTLLEQINQDQIYKKLFQGKKDLTFLDIGANIGLVSLYASPSCKKIVAVEPSPETFQVLKALTLNLPQIECVNKALAPVDGECEFFSNPINSTASSTVNTYGILSKVEGLTLNSMLRIYQLESVDICKVDCEGGEGESLNFNELSLARPVIKSYWVETHNCPKTGYEHKLGSLVAMLLRLGYEHQEVNGMCLYAS